LRDDTETATKELGEARSHFAELLRTLQANEDFSPDPPSPEGD
jgi:hypothetical protein